MTTLKPYSLAAAYVPVALEAVLVYCGVSYTWGFFNKRDLPERIHEEAMRQLPESERQPKNVRPIHAFKGLLSLGSQKDAARSLGQKLLLTGNFPTKAPKSAAHLYALSLAPMPTDVLLNPTELMLLVDIVTILTGQAALVYQRDGRYLAQMERSHRVPLACELTAIKVFKACYPLLEALNQAGYRSQVAMWDPAQLLTP